MCSYTSEKNPLHKTTNLLILCDLSQFKITSITFSELEGTVPFSRDLEGLDFSRPPVQMLKDPRHFFSITAVPCM